MIFRFGAGKQHSDAVKIGLRNIGFPRSGLTALIRSDGAGKLTAPLMIGKLLEMDEEQTQAAGMDVFRTGSDDLTKGLTILR